MSSVIGTTDGLVLKRDGLILCGCCEEPECCMYPADRLWLTGLGPTPEGFFTFEDLPDEVRVGSDVIQKDVFNISGNSFNVYTDLADPIERSIVWNVDEFTPGGDCLEQTGPDYTLGPGLGSSNPCCLIDNLQDVEDNFADCYEVTFREFIATAPNTPQPVVRTVERDTLCTWRAVDRCGNRVVLRYDVTRNKFVIQRAVYFNTVGLDCNFNTRIDLVKTGSQKSPVGNYEEDASVAEC
jgi:hypothetical protein